MFREYMGQTVCMENREGIYIKTVYITFDRNNKGAK
jgi:hypothetical protein